MPSNSFYYLHKIHHMIISNTLDSIKLIFVFLYFFLQIRYRFGLYDEIATTNGQKVRHCNWVRFLRMSESYGPQVSSTILVTLF